VSTSTFTFGGAPKFKVGADAVRRELDAELATRQLNAGGGIKPCCVYLYNPRIRASSSWWKMRVLWLPEHAPRPI
jgi:hypothetical protein